MSATAAKANRREIRRAFGEDACQAIEAHEAGLRAHAAALRVLNEHMRALESRVQALEKERRGGSDGD